MVLFLWREWTLILSAHVSRALEYAGCLCCPSGCSAFLALSYNGGLEHCDVIKPFKLLQLEFHFRKDEHPNVESTGQDLSKRDKSKKQARLPNKGNENYCLDLSGFCLKLHCFWLF